MDVIPVRDRSSQRVGCRIDRSPRRAFTLIELLASLAVIGVLLALLAPAIMSAREASRRLVCSTRLQQLGLALHNYHSQLGVLPFGVGADRDPTVPTAGGIDDRRYSAHSQLLPYLDQAPLYQRIDFHVAPFHPYFNAQKGPSGQMPVNGPAAVMRLEVLLCPTDLESPRAPWGQTNYRTNNGNTWAGRSGNGPFGQNSCVALADIRDGLSNTALMSERAKGRWSAARHTRDDLINNANLWTEAGFRSWCGSLTEAEAAAYPRDPEGGQTWLEGNMDWTRYNHMLNPNQPSCKNGITWSGVALTATSRHPAGVNVLFADGSVRFVNESIDTFVWSAMGSIAGGEQIAP